MVDHLLNTIIPSCVARNSFLVNEVPPHLTIAAEEKLVLLVLGNILTEVIHLTENDCIRINAAENGNLTTIHMKNTALQEEKSFLIFLETIQLISNRMGGRISFEQKIQSGITLSIRFNLDSQAAA